LQRYAPGEELKTLYCDWTISNKATEPINRVLAWILYCNDIYSGGTEFYWQKYHEKAEKGNLIIFLAGLSHIQLGKVTNQDVRIIATDWKNASNIKKYISRLANT